LYKVQSAFYRIANQVLYYQRLKEEKIHDERRIEL